MIEFDPSSGVPPYEQIRGQFLAQIAAGELVEETRLPTIRQLAADLGLASNTVARAYRELEQDGVFVGRGRKGTFVRSAGAAARQEPRALSDAARAFVTQARELGVDSRAALVAVSRALAAMPGER
jgi:DNA-binding transcriptional regulator YhcF (GntR family)